LPVTGSVCGCGGTTIFLSAATRAPAPRRRGRRAASCRPSAFPSASRPWRWRLWVSGRARPRIPRGMVGGSVRGRRRDGRAEGTRRMGGAPATAAGRTAACPRPWTARRSERAGVFGRARRRRTLRRQPGHALCGGLRQALAGLHQCLRDLTGHAGHHRP
jgi:hypothetical protein